MMASNLYVFVLFFIWFCDFTTASAYEKEGNPPRVVTSDITTLSANKGQTLTLPCMVSGNPFPLTVWWKDGSQISREWKRFKHQKTSLRIRNIELSDSGLYHCEAVNGYGTRQVEIQLQVHDESRLQAVGRRRGTVKPMFSQPIKMRRHNIVKPVGGTVSFKCKARGKPHPKIQWYKDGNLTQVPTSSGSSKTRWILTLHNIKSQDSGRYTCRVWNSVGEITFDYTLRVVGISRHERPVVLKPHPLNTTVKAGDKASLQCRVRSVIPPTVKWIKRLDRESLHSLKGKFPNNSLEINKKLYLILPPQEMMRLPDGSYLNKLVINQAAERDSGMYICLGVNTIGYNFRYAFLTVNPAGKSVITSRKVAKSSLSLTIIVGISAGVVLMLVCIVTIFCFKKRDQFGQLSGRNSERMSNQQLSNPNTTCYEEIAPLPTASSRIDETIAPSPNQQLLNVQYIPEVTADNSSHPPAFTSLNFDVNSTSNSNKNRSDRIFSEQSETDFCSNNVRSPPPPPPSQYSRSSSTDAGSRHRSHHSCHRSSRYHHYHHRYRTPPNSISSYSYCSHAREY